MNNYYFVAPSLPALMLTEKPDISFQDLMRRLELNLSRQDMEEVRLLRLEADLNNIRALY